MPPEPSGNTPLPIGHMPAAKLRAREAVVPPGPTLQRGAAEEKLALLGKPQRIWAVGSIYGRCGALSQLHENLIKKIRPKDRIVYLGNSLGPHSLWTGEGISSIDEVIAFRAAMISQPGFFAEDIVFLHGQGEDLFQQARRLIFRKDHGSWIKAALDYGLECYTAPYGGSAAELLSVGDKNIIAINRFTHRLQQAIRGQRGHEAFYANLKLAARTAYGPPFGEIGFVPVGLQPNFPLVLQGEYLCWPQQDIGGLKKWRNFRRILRGQAPKPGKPRRDSFVVTLDDSMGLEGKLHAACLDSHGRILDWLSF